MGGRKELTHTSISHVLPSAPVLTTTHSIFQCNCELAELLCAEPTGIIEHAVPLRFKVAPKVRVAINGVWLWQRLRIGAPAASPSVWICCKYDCSEDEIVEWGEHDGRIAGSQYLASAVLEERKAVCSFHQRRLEGL